jgi:hypothetical protein
MLGKKIEVRMAMQLLNTLIDGRDGREEPRAALHKIGKDEAKPGARGSGKKV